MAVLLSHLPPEIRKQVMAKLGLKKEPQPKKWSSGKRADLGNLFLRSSWEANYARILELQKKHGMIQDWTYEPRRYYFEKIRYGTTFYLPDFEVTSLDGKKELHELKGWRHRRGEVGLRRMAKYYPAIRIVLIDAAAYRELARQYRPMIPCWESAAHN